MVNEVMLTKNAMVKHVKSDNQYIWVEAYKQHCSL